MPGRVWRKRFHLQSGRVAFDGDSFLLPKGAEWIGKKWIRERIVQTEDVEWRRGTRSRPLPLARSLPPLPRLGRSDFKFSRPCGGDSCFESQNFIRPPVRRLEPRLIRLLKALHREPLAGDLRPVHQPSPCANQIRAAPQPELCLPRKQIFSSRLTPQTQSFRRQVCPAAAVGLPPRAGPAVPGFTPTTLSWSSGVLSG